MMVVMTVVMTVVMMTVTMVVTMVVMVVVMILAVEPMLFKSIYGTVFRISTAMYKPTFTTCVYKHVKNQLDQKSI